MKTKLNHYDLSILIKGLCSMRECYGSIWCKCYNSFSLTLFHTSPSTTLYVLRGTSSNPILFRVSLTI